MYMMLQLDSPDDFVICTGRTWSVLDFVKAAFERADLDYKNHVKIDPSLYRPAEVDYLLGSNQKAYKILGWKPKINFEELVADMVDHDINKSNIIHET